MSLFTKRLRPLEKDIGRDFWKRLWIIWSDGRRSLRSIVEEFHHEYPKACKKIVRDEVSERASDYLGYDVYIKEASVNDLSLSSKNICHKYNLERSHKINLKRYHDYSFKYTGRKLHTFSSKVFRNMGDERSFKCFAESMQELGINDYMNDYLYISLSKKGFLAYPCENLCGVDLENRKNTSDLIHYVAWNMLGCGTIDNESLLSTQSLDIYVDVEENDIFSLEDGPFKEILMRSIISELSKNMPSEWKDRLRIWAKYDLQGASVSLFESYDGINISIYELNRRLLVHRRCKVDLELALKEMNAVRAYKYLTSVF